MPFIARYRKEATGELDDTQLRNLEERLAYLRDLEDRRAAILASIEEQGKLTPELEGEIEDAETKAAPRGSLPALPAEAPHQGADRARGRPRATGAALLEDPKLAPETEAEKYLNADAGFADARAVLDGARQILMEKFAEDAELLQTLREYLKEHGQLRSTVVEGKESEGAKFRDWFDFAEPIASMPSHRALALLRGRNEGFLNVTLALDSEYEIGARPRFSSSGNRGLSLFSRTPASSASPPASASGTRTARPTNGWPTPCAGPGRSRSTPTLNWNWSAHCASAPRKRPSASSART